MKILDFIGGIINKMLRKEKIQYVINMTPGVSNKMRESIELWQSMYENKSPWISNNVKSLNLAPLIASEKARMATIEMQVKITGDSARAEFIKESFQEVLNSIRKQIEYGLALGGLAIKPYIVNGPDGYKIEYSYVKADSFYPLAFSSDGELTSAAFIDRVFIGDKVYSKVEVHEVIGNTCKVVNKVFMSKNFLASDELGKEVPLTDVQEWAYLQPEITIENVDTVLFAYFKNPEANTIDISSPLGASCFSRAAELIKHADRVYSSLLWEFKGGELAIDVDRTAVNTFTGANVAENLILPETEDRLFRRNLDLGSDDMYNVFSPALRDDNFINGLNNILQHIEDVTSLARGTISEINTREARTATELVILKQRPFSANVDIQKELEKVFKQLFDIIDIYCDLYDIVPSGEYAVAYKWDDSIIVNKDLERQTDLIDIQNGLISRVEYRMKWYGETKEQAEESIALIDEESAGVTQQPTEDKAEIVKSVTQSDLNKLENTINSNVVTQS